MFIYETAQIGPAEILLTLKNEHEIVGITSMSDNDVYDNLLVIAYANETTLYIYNSINGIFFLIV